VFIHLTADQAAPPQPPVAGAVRAAERNHQGHPQRSTHRARGRPARIIVKINALVDESVIRALYAASKDGVKIDLIVRGACTLKPGVPGLSENIKVRSVIGRFLEHSRIYYFRNDLAHDTYLASADWMSRNLFRRIEVAFPFWTRR
jgi:polyphosphate kinase